MDQSKTTLLSTSDLSVGFSFNKRTQVLFKNINMELRSGELVCFMGPNGIGKSSLIRTLAGLQKPLDGKIKVENEPIKLNPPKQISVVLTDKIVNTNLTGYELIAFGRYPYLDWKVKLRTTDESIIDYAIKLVNVQAIVDKKINELSDGQVQMIMIARALAQDTPIILLDEPTAHLDLNNRVEIMKLLKFLVRSTKKSILVSTHELDLALQMADWIWLAGRQKNILKGIPEDLVLDGSFDTIFEFKGFDLKTGKIQHEPSTGVAVQLTGDGYELLWTKNALERNGFIVSTDRLTNSINIVKEGSTISWIVMTESGETRFASLAELMIYLNQSIAYRNK